MDDLYLVHLIGVVSLLCFVTPNVAGSITFTQLLFLWETVPHNSVHTAAVHSTC